MQQICPWSLLPQIKPGGYEEANSGVKVLLRNIIFCQKSLVQTSSGSVLQERAAAANSLLCTGL